MAFNQNRGQSPRSVDFNAVRDKVPLTWFFENMLDAIAKPTAGQLRYHSCPNCRVSKDQNGKVVVTGDKWKCFKCGEKGDVVEAASKYWGIPLKDAALKLMGADEDVMAHYQAPKPLPAVVRDDSALEEAITKLVERSKAGIQVTDAALNYFLGRGINAEIVREAVRFGLLVILPNDPEVCKQYLIDVCGRQLLADAGLWAEDKKAPAAAFRPLMFVSRHNKAAEFRYLRLTEPNELKSMRKGGIHPWTWVREDDEKQNRIMMTEGAIDLLSGVALGTKRALMGLPGCENWRPDWFAKLGGLDVLTALDADGAGKTATAKIMAELDKVGADAAPYNLPGEATDLNEELILKRGYVRLEFFEREADPEPVRHALLSLPGCDTWTPAQFSKIQGRHIVIRTGHGEKRRINQAALERLCKTFERGGATFSVNPPTSTKD